MSTPHGGCEISHVDSGQQQQQEKAIDREKVCPLLLRIFCCQYRHNPLGDYNRGGVPSNELQIYTWLDCTLRELMSLIKDVNMETRRRGTEFNFSVVAPDRYSSRYMMRDVGITISGERSEDDNKTLSQCKFNIGDYVDVLISPPSANIVGGGAAIGAGKKRHVLSFVDRSSSGPRIRY